MSAGVLYQPLAKKERPILFSAPMVRAILDGSKTQTRRVFAAKNGGVWPHTNDLPGMRQILRHCPYGQPGDRLWVRESIEGTWGCDAVYVADDKRLVDEIGWDWLHKDKRTLPVKKIPSIHMPRWASRITLEITGVRVERLQDISDDDSLAEGIYPTRTGLYPGSPRAAYHNLWESINAANRPKLPRNPNSKRYARVKQWLDTHPDTTSWEANPWVWVVDFKRVQPC